MLRHPRGVLAGQTRPSPRSASSDGATTVVMATRNRRDRAVSTVRRLRLLPERPAIIVVDDGSTDGTSEAVRTAFDDVTVLRPGPRGVTSARNAGVRAATTPYVAFSDDDSWWAPGALSTAARHFERHPRLGLLAARILVGDDERLDPTCRVMAASPLPADGLPGPRILGFVACGTVVRRDAFLEVGGFPDDYVIGGEEEPLALALAAAGWDLAYVEEVVARHAPDAAPREGGGRDRNVTRNDLWTAWRYRRGMGAVLQTMRIVWAARTPAKLAGMAQAVLGLPSILAQRQPVPSHVEAQRRLLDGRSPGGGARV